MDISFEKLPAEVREAIGPVLDLVRPGDAMRALAPGGPISAEATAAVERAIGLPAIAAKPALVAGLWLYVDELDKSHTVSQSIEDATGSYWHGIMHRREPDFSNSHYWFRKAGDHPAMALVTQVDAGVFGGSPAAYDPHVLIDDAEAAVKAGESPAGLVVAQQCEWLALFVWCANR